MSAPKFPTPPRLEVNGREVTPEMLALVYAGPDLYAALEALLGFVEEATLAGVLDAGEMQDNVECAEARAALAKARGEG